MPISRFSLAFALASALTAVSATSSVAQDHFSAVEKEGMSRSETPASEGPWAAFKFGYSAYKKGDKKKAIEAYRFAADKGHPGARWKLAQMYSQGDGVPVDDLEAFRIYEEIVMKGADPATQDGAFVSSALVALANYLRRGIPGTPVVRNDRAARELYSQAALTFGNSEAQFQLGWMAFHGEGMPVNMRQAARWFSLASRKGHIGASAMLGNILFETGNVVKGLAMMTAALEQASPSDRDWIGKLQEQAFALSPESDRRTAIALAEEMRKLGK